MVSCRVNISLFELKTNKKTKKMALLYKRLRLPQSLNDNQLITSSRANGEAKPRLLCCISQV